jgi:hypothetical protein
VSVEAMDRLTRVQTAVNAASASMLGLVTDEGDLLCIDDTIAAALTVVERVGRLLAELRRLREMATAGRR